MKSTSLSVKTISFFIGFFLFHLMNGFSATDDHLISAKAQIDTVRYLLKNNHLVRAKEEAKRYLERVRTSTDKEQYIEAVKLLFRCYKRQDDFTDALVFLRKELDRTILARNVWHEANVRYCIGLLYQDIGDITKASTSLIKVLKLLDQLSQEGMDEEMLSWSKYHVYTDLAITMIAIDASKTLDYFDKAKDKALLLNDSVALARSYLNIGWAYLELEEYKSATNYLDTSMVLYQDHESIDGQASVYLELGILNKNKSLLSKALEYYQQSYQLLFDPKQSEENRFEYFYLKYATLEGLSEVRQQIGDWENALKYGLEYYDLVCEYKDHGLIAKSAEMIANLYEQKGIENKALEYFKIANREQRILKSNNMKVKVLKEEQAYELSKREHMISDLKLSTRKKDYALWFIVLLSGMLVVCVGLLGKHLKERRALAEQQLKEQASQLVLKSQSVANLSLINQSKNQLLSHLKGKLQAIYHQSPDKSPELKKVIFQLKNSANEEEDWECFHQHFMEVHPDFYRKLQQYAPNLTNLDVRHSALIRLNMSNKEAAKLLGVSPKSVQMARYRLKKKLNLAPNVVLKKWLNELS